VITNLENIFLQCSYFAPTPPEGRCVKIHLGKHLKLNNPMNAFKEMQNQTELIT